MNLEKAIKRIENIKKKEPSDYCIEGLIDEYLKRLALFFYKKSINPTNPILINITMMLGDTEKIELKNYCDIEENMFSNKPMWRFILTNYLQLVKYSEKNEKAKEYVKIHDPIIKLIEREIYFTYREGDILIHNDSYYPLYGWYDRVLKYLKKDGSI